MWKRRRWTRSSSEHLDVPVDARGAVDLANDLLGHYQRSDDFDALSAAVEVLRGAQAAVPARHPDRPMVLATLAVTMAKLFDRTEDVAVLGEAIEVGREAVAATPTDHPNRASVLSNLAIALRRLAEQTEELMVLTEAVEVSRAAVAMTTVDHPKLAMYLSNLGIALQAVFEHTKKSAVITEAVQVGRDAVAVTPIDHPLRGQRLTNLASALRREFEQTGQLATLREVVQLNRAAEAATPAEHPQRTMILSNLGLTLQTLFERTENLPALVEAADNCRDVVRATPGDDSRWAGRMFDLLEVLQELFDWTGEIPVLTEIVQLRRDMVAAIPVDDPDRPGRLSNLASTLRELSEWTGELSALTEAVEVGQEAVATISVDHPNRSGTLNNLGTALMALAGRTGDPDLLDEAVRLGREAVATTPADAIERAIRLNNLSRTLIHRFHHNSDPVVLTEAVRASREAVAALRADDANQAMLRSLLLGNLGVTLRQAFEITGELEMLVEAVQVARDAVAVTPIHSRTQRANSLGYLAGALGRTYGLTGDVSVLTEAVQATREAVATSPPNSPYRPMFQATLAGVLTRLYERTEQASALTEAVQAGSEAIATIPADDVERVSAANNLIVALRTSFERTGDRANLTEAARIGREVVTASAGGPSWASALENLGSVLTALFEQTGDPSIQAEARDCDRKIAASPGALPEARVRAYRRLGNAAMRVGGYQDALTAFEAAVELVPQIAPRAVSRSGREYSLSRIAGLATDVAAAAVAAGRPERAVELLEQTRGLLVGQTLDDRSDLTELCRTNPDLATEFENVRERASGIEAAVPDPWLIGQEFITGVTGDARQAQPRPAADIGEQRRRLAEQWTTLLRRIRAVPGFEQFLHPPPISRLQHQTNDGPIVVVYASEWGANALIVTPDPDRPVQVVPLADLTEAAVIEQVNRLRAAYTTVGEPTAGHAQAQRQVHEVLGWLWDTVTGPILDHLGFTGQGTPRIWWCPVDVLSYLPLHAAGHHNTPPETRRTVLDRAVSSYVITIRALEHARSHRATQRAPSGSAVVVAMPTTPGASDLPGAADEASAVSHHLGSPLILTGRAATYQAVTAALPHHRIAHFACHGLYDRENPGASRLLLHDHVSTPLTVSALTRLHLTDADLAYLSACSTTQTSENLVDEALHLTAAIHLAGYRHVIGTLWPIRDIAATRVATDIYTYITNAGAHPPRTDVSPHALSDAIRKLRNQYPAIPTVWAAYVHYGA